MNEFDWIQTYLAPLAGPEGLNLLDDAALYTTKADQDLVLTQDTLIEGVHFFAGDYGAATAERLLTVNLSDLAAKGARPVGYLLSVSWPDHLNSEALMKSMKGFCKGLEQSQTAFGFTLFGGDTVKTKGPMTLTATLIGCVPKGEMVKRSTAKIGDSLWVTGTIGDAHLGLLVAQEASTAFEHEPSGGDLWTWEKAFRHPVPQLLFRKTLRRYATSCADISDGLLSEAQHIAKASRMTLSVRLGDVPLSDASQRWCHHGAEEARRLALATGGDDYQLLFTAKPEHEEALLQSCEKTGVKVTKIGHVTAPTKGGRPAVECLDLTGSVMALDNLGYAHF